MTIVTAATPETGTATDDDADIASLFGRLDAEEGTGSPQDPEPAEHVDGDAEEAAESGDEAEPVEDADEPGEAEKPALDPSLPVKVKVNGEEIEVPLEEALKGYSREQDYTRSKMALAEERKALHGELAERLQTALDTFVQSDPVLAAAKDLDWAELARTEPSTYVALKAEVEKRQGVIQATQAQIAAAKAEEAKATVKREYELLVKADPQFADADTYGKRIGDVRDYLIRSYGFDDDALNAISNHKYILIAEKAAAYDKLTAAKKELPAKVSPPPKPQAKSLKSGDAPPPRSSPKPPGPNASQAQWKAWFDRIA